MAAARSLTAIAFSKFFLYRGVSSSASVPVPMLPPRSPLSFPDWLRVVVCGSSSLAVPRLELSLLCIVVSSRLCSHRTRNALNFNVSSVCYWTSCCLFLYSVVVDCVYDSAGTVFVCVVVEICFLGFLILPSVMSVCVFLDVVLSSSFSSSPEHDGQSVETNFENPWGFAFFTSRAS